MSIRRDVASIVSTDTWPDIAFPPTLSIECCITLPEKAFTRKQPPLERNIQNSESHPINIFHPSGPRVSSRRGYSPVLIPAMFTSKRGKLVRLRLRLCIPGHAFDFHVKIVKGTDRQNNVPRDDVSVMTYFSSLDAEEPRQNVLPLMKLWIHNVLHRTV